MSQRCGNGSNCPESRLKKLRSDAEEAGSAEQNPLAEIAEGQRIAEVLLRVAALRAA